MVYVVGVRRVFTSILGCAVAVDPCLYGVDPWGSKSYLRGSRRVYEDRGGVRNWIGLWGERVLRRFSGAGLLVGAGFESVNVTFH